MARRITWRREEWRIPRRDAELLLARALGLARIELYTAHDRPLTDAERSAARELVQRRGRREPLAYVLGDWDFRRLTLKTDRRALVPRPETELARRNGASSCSTAPSRRASSTSARAAVRSHSLSRRNARMLVCMRPTSRRMRSPWPPRTQRRTACPSRSGREICSQGSKGRSTSWSPIRRTSRQTSSNRSSRRCATGSRAAPWSTTARPRGSFARPSRCLPAGSSSRCTRRGQHVVSQRAGTSRVFAHRHHQ